MVDVLLFLATTHRRTCGFSAVAVCMVRNEPYLLPPTDRQADLTGPESMERGFGFYNATAEGGRFLKE